MPVTGKHDVFEDDYLDRLRALWSSKGLKVEYMKDRAALDGGLHLYSAPASDERTVSQTRIWFQAKGKRSSTLPRSVFANLQYVDVQVPVDHVQFWYASAEPVYLIVYVESVDLFLAEDVRDIVDRQWQSFYQQVPRLQKEVTLNVRTDALLNDALTMRMLRHRSMRIDGPSFRGRPLGHRFDPLRSEMIPPAPALFEKIVDKILDAHGFRTASTLTAPAISERVSRLRIVRGKFHQTLEWQWPMGTSVGFGEDDNEPRREAPVDFVHGDCLIIVDSSGRMSRYTKEESDALTVLVRGTGASRALIFVNGTELEGVGLWRGALYDLNETSKGCNCWPVALGSLSYMVLIASLVYLEFAPDLAWRYLNYLY
jgi:hypothetical protein